MLLLYWVAMEEFPDDSNDVEYYEWAKVDGKVKTVVKSIDVEEAIESFNRQVKILKAHIFVGRTQNTHNRPKENHSFSVFTARCYTRGIDGTLLNKNFTVTSEATGHSQIAALSCIF